MTTPAATSWPEQEPPVMFGAPGDPQPLVVPVAEVARRLGLDATALDAAQTQTVTDAIVDCTADACAKLGRKTLIPETIVLVGEQPLPWFEALDDPKAYQLPERYDDLVSITDRVPNVDDADLWDLTIAVGLDGREQPAIVRFITAHAVESLRLDRVAQQKLGLEVAMTTVSTEGQSITPQQRSQTPGAAGSLPTWDTIKRFRRIAAYARPTVRRVPWPYHGS